MDGLCAPTATARAHYQRTRSLPPRTLTATREPGSLCGAVVFDSATPCEAPCEAPCATPSFALVALRDIDEGAEMCISYTSTAEGPTQRRAHLRDYYGFTCACARCTADEVCVELAFSEALDLCRCANVDECGSGLTVPTAPHATTRRCVHCAKETDLDGEEPEWPPAA